MLNRGERHITLEHKRLDSTRYLGTQLHHHLNWTDEISTKISSCYKSLSVLRKLKHLAPYKIRKQLSECIVLSKLDYNDIVSHPIPEYLVKRLQRIQRAAAGLVVGRYATELDVLKLRWLPIKERRDFHLSQTVFKAFYTFILEAGAPHTRQNFEVILRNQTYCASEK